MTTSRDNRHDTYSELRGILRDTLAANLPMQEHLLRELVWDQVRDRQDFFRLLFDNWFIRNLPDQIQALKPQKPENSYQSRQSKQEDLSRRSREILRKSAATVLMNIPMPNGKKLRDCTAADLRQQGGWFILIADCLSGSQTVVQGVSEDRLHELWSQSQKAA